MRASYDLSVPTTTPKTSANMNLVHEYSVSYTYASKADLFGQSNAGISLTMSAGMTNPTADPGLIAWERFLETQLGTVVVSQSTTNLTGGIYDHVSSNVGMQHVLQQPMQKVQMVSITHNSGLGGVNFVYTVYMRYDGANSVQMYAEFRTQYTGGGSYNYAGGTVSPAGVTLYSYISLTKPSAAYLSNPVVAYPTVTELSLT